MTLREYLISSALLVDNPYEQERLRPTVKVVCDDATEPRLLNGYSVRGEKIFCHICGAHRHKKGITGQLSDGTRILFGRNCAEDFFGKKVWEKCWGELKRAQELAFARYRVLNLAKLCEPMDMWVASHRHQVLKTKETWDNIFVQHEQFFREVELELKRSGGRLTETDDVIVSSDLAAVGLKRSFSTTTIVASVRGYQYFPDLRDIDKHLIVVESFLAALKSASSELSDQQILEYSRRIERNVRPAVRRIDGALALTADFLSEEKLTAVGGWSDRKRIRSLSHLPSITPRKIAEAIRKISGYGFELPSERLEDAIPNLRRTAERLVQERRAI
jgi:hypothetical protein